MKKLLLISLLLSLFIAGCAIFISKKPRYDYSKMDRTTRNIHKKVEEFLRECITEGDPVKIVRYTRIDSLQVDKEKEHIDIYLNRFFSFIPFRPVNVQAINEEMKDELGWWYRDYTFAIYTTGTTIDQLIPNYYRSNTSDYDFSRMPAEDKRGEPLVKNIDKPYQPSNGLFNRNIALWHSHGWYYEQSLQRWEWQRARLFQTVEDIGPIVYTIPYIIPMLENAGARVFVPRERDFQIHEVIVDNDSYQDSVNTYFEQSTDSLNEWQDGRLPGFAIGTPPYKSGDNPFQLGGYKKIKSAREKTAEISWIPYIPETGNYTVRISYASLDNSVNDACYTVYHTGGKTEFRVNQQIGGPTWIYLGTFKFSKGHNPEYGRVELSNQSAEAGKWISADAVRFGGGMGVVEREGKLSGRPKYVEGARYWLQFAGMPDTLVFNLNEDQKDYNDDYQCRAEWLNYLKGAPYGPNKKRDVNGLGIPIDLSLAFHTDAGISHNDTVIGTLSIYSSQGADTQRVFPDSVSRYANRDFADILQTQIVHDLRKLFDPAWTRRGLWDRGYSEAYRPNVPAALLELLSHQNFIDMRFYHDPRFRFHTSRAIYKAMLRFLATQYQFDYVIQPLPVTHFRTGLREDGYVKLQWTAQQDPLEPTADPENYVVYTRKNMTGFDNGKIVSKEEVLIGPLQPGEIYSFKITALNAGGESFPSEILSVCRPDSGQDIVLIVNAFDRVSAPAVVNENDFKGFADFIDQGVADRYNLGYVGTQFNYKPDYPWKDDDAPGFGASHANFETKVIPGNTFDFTVIHGEAIKHAGYAFVSVSDEACAAGSVDLSEYPLIDIILGEERETWMAKSDKPDFKTFPSALQQKISEFCVNGGHVFVSGAYTGTDLWEKTNPDSADICFAMNVLKYKWRTNHASMSGMINAVDSLFAVKKGFCEFNSGFNRHIYRVEAPDGVEPADSMASTLLRYAENNISAAVGYKGDYNTMIMGFPFETIIDKQARHEVMRMVLKYLMN